MIKIIITFIFVGLITFQSFAKSIIFEDSSAEEIVIERDPFQQALSLIENKEYISGLDILNDLADKGDRMVYSKKFIYRCNSII